MTFSAWNSSAFVTLAGTGGISGILGQIPATTLGCFLFYLFLFIDTKVASEGMGYGHGGMGCIGRSNFLWTCVFRSA